MHEGLHRSSGSLSCPSCCGTDDGVVALAGLGGLRRVARPTTVVCVRLAAQHEPPPAQALAASSRQQAAAAAAQQRRGHGRTSTHTMKLCCIPVCEGAMTMASLPPSRTIATLRRRRLFVTGGRASCKSVTTTIYLYITALDSTRIPQLSHTKMGPHTSDSVFSFDSAGLRPRSGLTAKSSYQKQN